jgi:hypothetical protein
MTFCNSRMFPGHGYDRSNSKPILLYAADRLSRLPREAVQEVFYQQRNVLSACAQRRDFDRENIEPVKQVASKSAGGDGSLQVAVRGGDHANIRLNRARAADTLKLVLL